MIRHSIYSLFLLPAALAAAEFHDDFSSGALTNWRDLWPADAWSVADGALRCDSFSGGTIIPRLVPETGEQLSFRFNKGLDADADHHCGLRLTTADGTEISLIIRANFRYWKKGMPGEKILGSRSVNLANDRWYTVTLVFTPEGALFLVDGRQFGTIPEAREIRAVKFYSHNQQFKLDDVRVAPTGEKR